MPKLFCYMKDISDQVFKRYLEQISPIDDVLEAFSRVSYQHFFIIDLVNNEMVYTSNYQKASPRLHTYNRISSSPNYELKDIGRKEIQLLYKMKESIEQIMHKHQAYNRERYTLSHNIYTPDYKNKCTELINYQFTPISFSNDGIKSCLCVTSISPYSTRPNTILYHHEEDVTWQYSIMDNSWTPTTTIELGVNEKKVIKLSAQGHSIMEIADIMHKSFDTVKFYRKNIFRKLGVNNITEAFSRALCMHLL